MNFHVRREAFRALLDGNECTSPASVFDPLSARLAEDLGFSSAVLAGSVASMVILGAPDLAVITASELAEQAHRICRATQGLPLLIDADHGYGNALSVRRTVGMLEMAGVAAITIEDTLLPARFDAGDATELISLDEGVGKMRAALDGRTDTSLVIAGRTSALAVCGLDETIRRCRAYQHAGVDAIFLSGAKQQDEVQAIQDAIDLPIMLGGTPRSIGSKQDLALLNVRIALPGHQTYAAALGGVERIMQALLSGTHPDEMPDVPKKEFLKRLTRERDYDRWSAETLIAPDPVIPPTEKEIRA